MKVIVSMCFCLLMSVFTTNAQTGHLKFKNIDIQGSQDKFLSSLKSQGFNEKGANLLTGKFAGYEAFISTDTTPVTSTVFQVRIELEKSLEWRKVKDEYEIFKENLIIKYGQPAISKESFEHPYRDGDGYELKAISLGKVRYSSCWLLPNGMITIQITGNEGVASLMIRYTDSHGMELQSQEEKQVFSNDL